MAEKDKDPKEKTVGDKVIDIIHDIFRNKDTDPVAKTIEGLSETSVIGGKNRKRKTDDAIEKSGG